MLGIAFSLGFFGSLHCVGMCGPLALMGCQSRANNSMSSTYNALFYNLGRVTTYGFLGVIFGLIGQYLLVSNFQKILAISLGLAMMVSFFFSVNVDSIINKSFIGKSISQYVQKLFSFYFQHAKQYAPFILGILNGLLPCGLVYLALAGSLTTESIWESAVFMIIFGLGTTPAMIGLVSGFTKLSIHKQHIFKKYLPLVTLCFGLFLIYRGIFIDIPMELNFWEALKHPIMCH